MDPGLFNSKVTLSSTWGEVCPLSGGTYSEVQVPRGPGQAWLLWPHGTVPQVSETRASSAPSHLLKCVLLLPWAFQETSGAQALVTPPWANLPVATALGHSGPGSLACEDSYCLLALCLPPASGPMPRECPEAKPAGLLWKVEMPRGHN